MKGGSIPLHPPYSSSATSPLSPEEPSGSLRTLRVLAREDLSQKIEKNQKLMT